MNKITDEMLNKFIDNELDQVTYKMVQVQLHSSEEVRKRLKALQLVHKELKKIKEDRPPQDFTYRIMERLAKKSKAEKEQKIFISLVSSVFVTIALGILVYLGYYIFSAASDIGFRAQIGNMAGTVENFIKPVKSIMRGDNISIIGSIFSFFLLVSVYFIFDSLKNSKNILSRQH